MLTSSTAALQSSDRLSASSASSGFSAVTIAVLAVGIGARIPPVFLLLDAVLLKPLPYTAPDTLLHVTARERTQRIFPGAFPTHISLH